MGQAKVMSFLVHSNIYIALSCAVLLVQARYAFGIDDISTARILFVFTATFLEYNAHRFLLLIQKKELANEERYRWAKEQPVLFMTIYVMCMIITVIIFFFLKKQEMLIALAAGFLAFFYSVPFLKRGASTTRLRSIPYLKIFIIAAVWSIITAIFPLADSTVSTYDQVLFFIVRFLFLLAITIPFDIRDIETDKAKGLRTIPMLTGQEGAYVLSTILIVASALILGFTSIQAAQLLASWITFAITAVFISVKIFRSHKQYHYLLLDGTMLIWGLLSILTKHFVE